MTGPTLYGIARSNRLPDGFWRRECFPSSFAVALMNYMRDSGIPANYVSTDETTRCRVSSIPLDAVYRCGKARNVDLIYDFDSVPDGATSGLRGMPAYDLVVRDPRGNVLSWAGLMVSVVPDASTRRSDPRRMGPEMTLRTPDIAACAAGIADACRFRSDEALSILEAADTAGLDWRSWEDVSGRVGDMVSALNELQRRFHLRQWPMTVQVIWRTEGGSPVLADEAMDVFVWSDFAISRLFLDRGRPAKGALGRPQRCSAMLFRALMSVLSGQDTDLMAMMEGMRYGSSGDRELMVNGRCVNRYLRSERLLHPVITAGEAVCLASPGSEELIAPERRLDSSLYIAMTSMRG